MAERLQKLISQAGLASRRAAEKMILAGKVIVDGKVITELGQKFSLTENVIIVDGKKSMPKKIMFIILSINLKVTCRRRRMNVAGVRCLICCQMSAKEFIPWAGLIIIPKVCC